MKLKNFEKWGTPHGIFCGRKKGILKMKLNLS